MRTVAVLSRKGGTGKTTVAVHLAVAAQAAGHRTVLMDMDSQKSACAWARVRGQPSPSVSDTRAGALYFSRQAAERLGVGMVVIDTPPACDAQALDAARWADLCLIVVRPSFLDIEAVASTVDAVRSLRKPMLFLINQAPRGEGRAVAASVAALQRYGSPVCPAQLTSRSAYQSAIGAGRSVQEAAPEGAAAEEVAALWRHLDDMLGLAGASPERQAACA